jgi:predicted homoserine dehydrogenase-like protein
MKNNGIRLGIIGIGAMGKGLLYQSRITPGIECSAIADVDVQRCIDALTWLRLPFQVVNTPDEMDVAIEEKNIAVCESGLIIAQCKKIQAVMEASSSILSAIDHSTTALENHKHLILMNSEIDLTFGPALAESAKRQGVIFTSCDGDQYGVLKNMIEDIKFWGFDLVMAGNIKGFLNRYANPTTIIPEADKRNLDYRMCASYTDGTKLNIEMAIIANACGLITKTPGMFGPEIAHVKDVFKVFDFNQLWKNQQPFVDYILGAEPGGGVFVIGHCDNPYQQDMLSYYKMGIGPFYLFYRPYHLCHIEALSTLVKHVVNGQSFLAPVYGIKTNVYSYAKRNIQPGELLDGVGGYTCFGKIENLQDNIDHPGLPICLADNVVINRSIKQDQKIYLSDIDYDTNRIDFELYGLALKYLCIQSENGES